MLKFPRKKPGKARRARGTGAIFYSRRLKLWIGRVPIGRANGRTLYQERRAPTQAELLAKLAAIAPPGPTTTVAEWCERWLKSLHIRPSSLADYRHTIDRFVVPSLGLIELRSLTSHDVERALVEWSEKLTPNTLRKNLQQFRGCCEAARRAKLIEENPASLARKPRAKRVVIDPFSPEELRQVIEGGGPCGLMAAIGCRLGEALALDVTDFDPVRKILVISRTWDKRHGMREAKSEYSLRTLTLPAQAIPILEAAITGRKRGPLFVSSRGTRAKHEVVRESFRRRLARLGVRYRAPHQLRHSVATLLVSAGVSLADVARHLGHSLKVMVATYVHPTRVNPMETMERILRGG